MPDLAGADLAKAQMRRERRGTVVIGTIAIAAISFDAIGKEVLEPPLRSRFAGLPRLAQASGPVGMTRLQLPVLEPVARDISHRRQPLWCGQGGGRVATCLPAAPERREHAQASAFLGPDVVWRSE